MTKKIKESHYLYVLCEEGFFGEANKHFSLGAFTQMSFIIYHRSCMYRCVAYPTYWDVYTWLYQNYSLHGLIVLNGKKKKMYIPSNIDPDKCVKKYIESILNDKYFFKKNKAKRSNQNNLI